MTPAHLARWARAFPRGLLTGPPGELRWDGAPPGEEAFAPWAAPRGPVTAELACSGVRVTLLPGVVLAVEGARALRIDAPLSEAGTLTGPGTAAVVAGRWVVRCGAVGVPAFDTVALTPEGRIELRGRDAGPARAGLLRVGGRALTAALRQSGRWSRIARFLPPSR